MATRRKRLGKFLVGQDVTLLPSQTSFGKVVGFEHGHVMVRWSYMDGQGDVRSLRVVTGHLPRSLKPVPPGYGL